MDSRVKAKRPRTAKRSAPRLADGTDRDREEDDVQFIKAHIEHGDRLAGEAEVLHRKSLDEYILAGERLAKKFAEFQVPGHPYRRRQGDWLDENGISQPRANECVRLYEWRDQVKEWRESNGAVTFGKRTALRLIAEAVTAKEAATQASAQEPPPAEGANCPQPDRPAATESAENPPTVPAASAPPVTPEVAADAPPAEEASETEVNEPPVATSERNPVANTTDDPAKEERKQPTKRKPNGDEDAGDDGSVDFIPTLTREEDEEYRPLLEYLMGELQLTTVKAAVFHAIKSDCEALKARTEGRSRG